MDLKNYSTGVQHIGIPTNDIDKTVDFYHKLGFETAFETVNEEADEKVVFLKLGTLVVEAYENHAAVLRAGAIDHRFRESSRRANFPPQRSLHPPYRLGVLQKRHEMSYRG